MLIRLVLTLIFMMLAAAALPASAQAASFDCSKAATPFEKAICADPELSAQDQVLSVAYKTAVGGLSQAAADQMLAGQRSWLKSNDLVCSDAMLPGDKEAADPGADVAQTERIACLKTAYQDRIKVLENSRMLGGLRFFNIDKYQAAPDPEGESYYKVSNNSTSLTHIDGQDAMAKAFNGFADKAVAEGTSDEIETSSDYTYGVAVKAVTANRIDLEVDTYWYGHGAAHGEYTVTYRHFLKDDQRGLEASDIFKGKDWVKHLAAIVLKQLKTEQGDALFDIDEDELEKSVADPSDWDLSPDGLKMQFQPYEVASYADGAVTTLVKWDALKDDLADTADALVRYDY
ncbi:MAG TPA: DUF3298 domain-containing protein [Devosiaceae bacterium]|jgi:uncharacterized protein